MSLGRPIRYIAVSALVLVTFVAERGAAAERPILIDSDGRQFIGESVALFEDSSARASFTDVSSPSGAAQFQDSDAQHPNFGFTQSALWFRFTLENGENRDRALAIEIGREWIERVDLYRLDTGEHVTSGSRLPIASRPLRTERLALPITLASHARVTYLLRIEGGGSMALDGTIMPLDAFLELDARERLLFGGFYAVLLAMAAYNLLLYLALRDGSAVRLSGMLAGLALAEACSHGHVSRLVPWGAGWFEIRGGALAFAACAFLLPAFTRVSLDTATRLPRFDRALRAMGMVAAAAFGLVAVLPSFGALGWGAMAANITLSLIVSVRRYRDRDRGSLYFLLAISALVIPGSFTIASLLGLTPLIPALDQWNHLGAVVMTCLLSLGIAERIRHERDARRALQQQTNTLNIELQVLNEELRHQVASRSKELADALAKLAHQPRAQIEPGNLVDGRYRVVCRLGAGGMGSVYEVERLVDRERLALKRLHGRADAKVLARFAREAQIAAELRHPNLLPVTDVGVADGELFLIMPLVAGGSLETLRERFGEVAWARQVLAEIALGLAALHERGIVHRDLKPGNVLMDAGVARISDFGLSYFAERTAKPIEDEAPGAFASTVTGALGRAGLTRHNDVLGTPHYMAPELAHGVQAAAPATDIFSFGVIAFELATGKRPFHEPAVHVVLAGGSYSAPDSTGVDASLRTLINGALAADPAARPTARELAHALARTQN